MRIPPSVIVSVSEVHVNVVVATALQNLMCVYFKQLR
jgi:hypothetical protein